MAKQAPIILDDDDPPPRNQRDRREESREGFEMGLASAFIGATFLFVGIMAPLVLNFLKSSRGGRSYGPGSSGYLDFASIVGILIAETICVIGIILGMRGISKCRSEGRTRAISASGLLLSIAATLLWLIPVLILLEKI